MEKNYSRVSYGSHLSMRIKIQLSKKWTHINTVTIRFLTNDALLMQCNALKLDAMDAKLKEFFVLFWFLINYMHLNSLCVSIKEDLRQFFYSEIIQQDVPEKRNLGHPVEIEISRMERLAQN